MYVRVFAQTAVILYHFLIASLMKIGPKWLPLQNGGLIIFSSSQYRYQIHKRAPLFKYYTHCDKLQFQDGRQSPTKKAN